MESEVKRVRYVKQGIVLRSFRTYLVGSSQYMLEINPLSKTVYLLNVTDNSVVKEKQVSGGLHKMKIQARLLLEETGLPTAKENRASRKEAQVSGT